MKPVLYGAIIIILLGCQTNGVPRQIKFQTAPLMGMVYDAYNNPCNNASIKIDDKIAVVSDVNGHFVIPSLRKGSHTIVVTKDGFKDTILEFDFTDRKQVLHMTLFSFQFYIDQAQIFMDQNRWSAAQQALVEAEELNPDDPRLIFLRALLLYNLKDWEASKVTLLSMLEEGREFASVYLLLADIAEFYEDDIEGALLRLNQYLNLVGDIDVKERRKRLVLEKENEETTSTEESVP